MRKNTLKPAFLLLIFVLLACYISGCSNTEEPAASIQEQQNAEEPAASTQEQQNAEEPAVSAQEQQDAEEPATSTQNAEQKEMEQQEPSESSKEDYIVENIEIVIGDTIYSAKLYDNEAAQALAAQLPLTLDMNELNGNEKYYYLSDSLPANSGVPAGINTGDLMLYGSDCLVLFYKSFSTSYSYTPLGRVADPEGLAQTLGSGSVQITFQKRISS